MNKFVQFLVTNVITALWNFIVKKLKELQRKMRYESDKKKIEQASVDVKDRKLKYKATKSIEDIIGSKK